MQNMTPSTEIITLGQIAKIQENLGAGLRKSGILKDAMQMALQYNGPAIIRAMVEAVRKCAERFRYMIVRHVTVDRNQNPFDALKETGCNLYVFNYLVETMPKGNGTEVDVFFFKLGYPVDNVGLENEYELRGFKPADPYSLVKANKDDHTLADKHPNCTYWRNSKGEMCLISFDQWRSGNRDVGIRYSDNKSLWSEYQWFAGIPK